MPITISLHVLTIHIHNYICIYFHHFIYVIYICFYLFNKFINRFLFTLNYLFIRYALNNILIFNHFSFFICLVSLQIVFLADEIISSLASHSTEEKKRRNLMLFISRDLKWFFLKKEKKIFVPLQERFAQRMQLNSVSEDMKLPLLSWVSMALLARPFSLLLRELIFSALERKVSVCKDAEAYPACQEVSIKSSYGLSLEWFPAVCFVTRVTCEFINRKARRKTKYWSKWSPSKY